MQKINEVIKSNDCSTIEFYIENTYLLQDIFKKRNVCTKEIDSEMHLLLKRYKELTGKEYNL